ncbi:MAG: lipocalin-like domain-containing protein [Smithella sp.]
MKKIKILSLFLFLLFISACAPVYTLNHSAPVNPIVLPDDGAAHYWAQNEWWYYTGHLTAQDGRAFGYELTFFKRITNEDNVPAFFIPVPAHWLKDVGMLGHFAVTDLQSKKFKAKEINNFIFNKARADEKKYDLMIDTWTAREEKGKHILCAEMKDYKIELELEPLKPAAFHGRNGIVNKGANHANYYYSFTRMRTSGTITVEGTPVKVEGMSWMDHEYGTMKLGLSQTGWDWFSVQLDNNCELMIYLIRNDKDAMIETSGGTFVSPDGKTVWLTKDDIDIKTLNYWYSKKTDSNYPASWEITVKSLNLKLNVNPVLAQQELELKPMPYWEGSVSVEGILNDSPVTGKGYVELVGYSKKYPLSYM